MRIRDSQIENSKIEIMETDRRLEIMKLSQFEILRFEIMKTDRTMVSYIVCVFDSY